MTYEDLKKLYETPLQYHHNPEFAKIQKKLQEKRCNEVIDEYWVKYNKDLGQLLHQVVGAEK